MFLKNKNFFFYFVVLIIYLIVSFQFLKLFRFQLNSDGVSYINIAQKYLSGNFHDAINGHWAPLFSWLIVPFLIFIKDPLLATKIASIFIGIPVLYALGELAKQLEISPLTRMIIIISTIPIVTWFAIGIITPDLLVSGIILIYFGLIFNKNYSKKIYLGILVGFVGGLCYLTKQFAGVYFLFHFIAFSTIYLITKNGPDDRKIIIKNLFIALSIFFLIFIFWNGLVSLKYNRLIISNPGALNHAWKGPNSPGFLLFVNGLLEPPNKSALSAWEDPISIKFTDWSPFDSKSNWDYQVFLIKSNYSLSIDKIKGFSTLLIFIYFIIFFDFLLHADFFITKIAKQKNLFFILTIVPYILGYSTIHIEIRYLWPILFLLIIIAGLYLDILLKHYKLSLIKKIVVYIIFSIFIINIAWPNLKANIYPEGSAGTTDFIYSTANKLMKNYHIVNKKIASNINWEITDLVSFLLNSKYYGITINNDKYSILNDLKKYDIDYYIVWEKTNNFYDFLNKYKEVTNDKEDQFRIYSLKELIKN